ncbi:hypothetical protein NKH77_25610 [Streptomyces sp. M19]
MPSSPAISSCQVVSSRSRFWLPADQFSTWLTSSGCRSSHSAARAAGPSRMTRRQKSYSARRVAFHE